MAKFDVQLCIEVFFDDVVDADTKEEAIDKAIENANMEMNILRVLSQSAENLDEDF
jgi:hypothetical protein